MAPLRFSCLHAVAVQVILPILKQHFKRDEFIGRINEILFFLPFTDEQLRKIARMELTKWKVTANERRSGT